ncbi:MAG: hypothetical protein ACD_80C00131G0001 [uncultured bacterium (gcode 4)]|uniref:GIY-YIG domain-containing protein n=1 Tax=uncultured bacterium (gcode 4) TaxID=1234023 RepID=K1XX78_9BACT|nr:MAG: hypothetical protein ACD_80C00131G0001 [uncultured bacterium (gcode 4)]
MYYVYILKWDIKYYIWYTNDLEKRFAEHIGWLTPTTKKMWTLYIIWYFIKKTKTEAIKLERMIKKNGHIDHWINHETFVQYGGCSSVG